MKTFIWKEASNTTRHFHSRAGVVVVARDLEQARFLLREARTPNENWYDGCDEDEPKGYPIQSQCSAFADDPDLTIDAGNEPSGLVLVFPNKGCC